FCFIAPSASLLLLGHPIHFVTPFILLSIFDSLLALFLFFVLCYFTYFLILYSLPTKAERQVQRRDSVLKVKKILQIFFIKNKNRKLKPLVLIYKKIKKMMIYS
ncbi:MAG: hypothetical protein SFU27_09270, partial [Thermonemataceae bacterium]|nr:hypothetical protein [Thermonemataceae bacterium]